MIEALDVNPYESPQPPEEQVAFREVGEVWAGWKRVREAGILLFSLGILGIITIPGLEYISPLRIGVIPRIVVGLLVLTGLVAIVAGRAGGYCNTIVNMFRGDYD
jgi:hypothetical protein